ncbi:hypothetical protein N7478_003182 [Penicillium angulare]|uniref:uncharacterized protein n=1 Tax=Penicillium angulare TaxID=116970 RepID=UPI00253F879D|nr:uncharacterized protein N7478_003182 [Penicillium angulare]KAJ5287496.1 hypothetical protein N7478_003182 [Penicillium angulare]
MSLDPVTSGLTNRLPINKAEQATRPVKNIPKLDKSGASKQLNKTTNDLTDPIVPGEFPRDEGQPRTQHEPPQGEMNFSSAWSSVNNWFHSLFPQAMDRFEDLVKWAVQYLFPPSKQAEMFEGAMKRPIATTFIVCQIICCGVPLLIFLAGVFVFAAVALLLWAVLSLVILGPVLLVASMMGVSLWGWGWILYGLMGWVDQRFFGGMISRFFLPRMQAQSEGDGEGEGGEGEKEEQTEGEKKDT